MLQHTISQPNDSTKEESTRRQTFCATTSMNVLRTSELLPAKKENFRTWKCVLRLFFLSIKEFFFHNSPQMSGLHLIFSLSNNLTNSVISTYVGYLSQFRFDNKFASISY